MTLFSLIMILSSQLIIRLFMPFVAFTSFAYHIRVLCVAFVPIDLHYGDDKKAAYATKP